MQKPYFAYFFNPFIFPETTAAMQRTAQNAHKHTQKRTEQQRRVFILPTFESRTQKPTAVNLRGSREEAESRRRMLTNVNLSHAHEQQVLTGSSASAATVQEYPPERRAFLPLLSITLYSIAMLSKQKQRQRQINTPARTQVFLSLKG